MTASRSTAIDHLPVEELRRAGLDLRLLVDVVEATKDFVGPRRLLPLAAALEALADSYEEVQHPDLEQQAEQARILADLRRLAAEAVGAASWSSGVLA